MCAAIHPDVHTPTQEKNLTVKNAFYAKLIRPLPAPLKGCCSLPRRELYLKSTERRGRMRNAFFEKAGAEKRECE